jgi:hypothetical protein
MTYLSSLSFTTVPHTTNDPKQIRRQRLLERLEEQRRLAADPSFLPVVKVWKKSPDGSRVLVDSYRRLKPWWKTDSTGNVILTIRSGMKVLEFEKGKTGILVGSVDALDQVFGT